MSPITQVKMETIKHGVEAVTIGVKGCREEKKISVTTPEGTFQLDAGAPRRILRLAGVVERVTGARWT